MAQSMMMSSCSVAVFPAVKASVSAGLSVRAQRVASSAPRVPLSAFLGQRLNAVAVAPRAKISARPSTSCEAKSESKSGIAALIEKNPNLETGFYFGMWYFLNVIFNIINKKVYGFFPFPWAVSVVHLLVGTIYCLIAWKLKSPKREVLTKDQIIALAPVAFCHAAGHVAANVSFALVAVSFTHTIKALEPFFAVLASIFVLGEKVSIPIMLSILPIVGGVSAASLTELSFNWPGFWGAMISNLTFTYRNIFSKKAMASLKTLDSVNLYAYISILSLLFCIPPTLVIEGPRLVAGWNAAVGKVGLTYLLQQLLLVGFFYHTYNQVAFQALEKVAPVTYAVGNVLKRVFVIAFSIVIFGNKITMQTAIGTIVALLGVTWYSLEKAAEKTRPKPPAAETAAAA